MVIYLHSTNQQCNRFPCADLFFESQTPFFHFPLFPSIPLSLILVLVLLGLAQYKVGARKSIFELMETVVGYDTLRDRVRETSKTYLQDLLDWIKTWFVSYFISAGPF